MKLEKAPSVNTPKAVCFGSVNRDMTYSVPQIVRSGETITSIGLSTAWGGKGLNQAVALAATGVPTALWARTGAHDQEIIEFLSGRGVDVSHITADPQVPTGHALVQLELEGSNCIIIYPGANRTHREEQIDEILRWYSAGDLLIVQNETNLVAEAVEVAASHGLRVAFNPSPLDRDALSVDLDAVDFLFVNEHEATALTSAPGPEAALDCLARRWPRMQTVMTLGGKGSIWRQGEESCAVDAVISEVVDTTGAGDTFAGFFLGSVLRGFPAGRALETASRAASLAIGRKGAAGAIPAGELVGF